MLDVKIILDYLLHREYGIFTNRNIHELLSMPIIDHREPFVELSIVVNNNRNFRYRVSCQSIPPRRRFTRQTGGTNTPRTHLACLSSVGWWWRCKVWSRDPSDPRDTWGSLNHSGQPAKEEHVRRLNLWRISADYSRGGNDCPPSVGSRRRFRAKRPAHQGDRGLPVNLASTESVYMELHYGILIDTSNYGEKAG